MGLQFLGNVVVPPSGSQNNLGTSTPFHVPPFTNRLVLNIDGESSGYNFKTGPASSSLASSSGESNQKGPANVQIPLPQDGREFGIAIFNGGAGGTVGVYAADGPLQS